MSTSFEDVSLYSTFESEVHFDEDDRKASAVVTKVPFDKITIEFTNNLSPFLLLMPLQLLQLLLYLQSFSILWLPCNLLSKGENQ